MSKAHRDRYHHGQLPAAITAEALDRVEAEGVEALSLRACARALGVDPAAAYRHFKDKEAVLAAVAQAGAEALDATLRHAASGGDGVDQLIDFARGYVGFAADHPHLFGLIYSAHGEGGAAPSPLAAALKTLVAEGRLSPGERAPLQDVLWLALHGLAALTASRPGGDRAALMARCEQLCVTVLAGPEG